MRVSYFLIAAAFTLLLSACSTTAEKAEEYASLACEDIRSMMRSYDQQSLAYQNMDRGRGDNTDLQDSYSRDTQIQRDEDRLQKRQREEIAALRLAYKRNGC